jgi:proteic killer suppression protein
LEFRFANDDLRRLDAEKNYTGGFPTEVVRKFRARMQMIRSAVDERAFYAMKSLHFEKLKGDRSHQRSMRLNQQWRLVLESEKGDGKNVTVLVLIEDYH